VEVKCKFPNQREKYFSVLAMETYRRCRSIDPNIDIGTRWKYVVNTTRKPLKPFLPDKPRYPLNGK